MKNFTVFGILMVLMFTIGIISTADAHPHGTINLMESHSHDIDNIKFQENFIIHTFEEAIFSMFNFINDTFFIKS